MSRVPLLISAGLIAAAGLALMIYKVVALGYPILPASESDVWTVQARFTVDSYTRPVKAILQLPSNPPGFVILDENFVTRGFGLNVVEEGIWREAQWAIREAAGRQTFYYRAIVADDGQRRTRDCSAP
ncbi:MAG: UUP1 family membrane protein [Acidobacteriota bacterium]